jgi:hypothetical protein
MNFDGQKNPWSFQKTFVFWWILFVAIQMGERLFLLTDALGMEWPSGKDFGIMLLTGVRADLIMSTILLVLSGLLTIGFWGLEKCWGKCLNKPGSRRSLTQRFKGTSFFVGILLILFLTIDMGYYGHSKQHIDYVFLEYIENLFQPSQFSESTNQATFQTTAELQQTQKWATRLLGFFALQIILIASWWFSFNRIVAPLLHQVQAKAPRYARVGLACGLVVGATGLDPYGPYAAQRAGIASSTYFTLAQNSLWYGTAVFIETMQSRAKKDVQKFVNTMPFDQALQVSRNLLHPDSIYPYDQYPFVRQISTPQGLRFNKPANVLLLFVEGLDRRYLGRSIDPTDPNQLDEKILFTTRQYEEINGTRDSNDRKIQVTPFLDKLRKESLVFENFFANGYPTSRGLFGTFCSYYPKFGDPEMRTRHSYDFFCLPSALRQFGYRSEMVIGFNRDDSRHHIGLFMARNGLDHLFDESDFTDEKARMGWGMTDGAILALMKKRMRVLQERDGPFLLAGLTLSTHHPYKVPLDHPDVRALQNHRDPYPYMHTLRYFDLMFEEFFNDLKKNGLLKNTVVLILGDHGRSAGVGQTDPERQMSYFLAPLFIWVDESLDHAETFRPLVVKEIASQTDIAPTILGMNGLTPRVAPFLGRDLTCVVVKRDCLRENVAFLKSGRHSVIGLADRYGILLHSVQRGSWLDLDHKFKTIGNISWDQDTELNSRAQNLLALYVSTNVVLEQNRIWSWKDLQEKL